QRNELEKSGCHGAPRRRPALSQDSVHDPGRRHRLGSRRGGEALSLGRLCGGGGRQLHVPFHPRRIPWTYGKSQRDPEGRSRRALLERGHRLSLTRPLLTGGRPANIEIVMTWKARSRWALPATAIIAALATLAATEVPAAEWIAGESSDYCVEING